MSAEKVILLLGRRDEPTDGVADYCEKLREAGSQRGISFEPVQLPWAENGWGPRLRNCEVPPPVGAIAGFCCNTRRWPGRAADFRCARREFSMFFGNAALAPALFFTTSCRCAARESSAASANISSCAYCASFMRVRTWPSSPFR